MILLVLIGTLLIAVMTDKVAAKLMAPFMVYINLAQSYPISLAPILLSVTIYYYKLRFDQINDEIKSICKTDDLIPFRDQIKLIILIRKHASLGRKMHQYKLAMRRSASTFYLMSSFILNLSLHLIVDTKDSFERSLYGQYIVSILVVGFGASLLSSMQITSAHGSYKYLFEIFPKQKFMFRFQWMVSYLR